VTNVPVTWRKSSFSAEETDCVEVASDLSAVRDSKNPDVELTADIRQLVRFVRAALSD
jgi:hypothetical protein